MADLSYLNDLDERLKGEDRARADFRNMLDIIREANDLAGGIAASREELAAVRAESARLVVLRDELRSDLAELRRQITVEREAFHSDLERRRASTAAALYALEVPPSAA